MSKLKQLPCLVCGESIKGINLVCSEDCVNELDKIIAIVGAAGVIIDVLKKSGLIKNEQTKTI